MSSDLEEYWGLLAPIEQELSSYWTPVGIYAVFGTQVFFNYTECDIEYNLVYGKFLELRLM